MVRIPRHPAGISARQDQLGAHQRERDFKTKVLDPLFAAVEFFYDKCIICFMCRNDEWVTHISDNCTLGVATNKGDAHFPSFRKNAIRLGQGWCFGCLINQVRLYIYII